MKILGVDPGEVRTGLAVCDKSEMLASPLMTIKEYSREKLAGRIVQIAQQEKAEQVVVGCPVNMNGTRGPAAEKSEELARRIEELSELPVVLWDERRTTVEAHGYLSVSDVSGKRRKETVDQLAAVLILEGYLNFRKQKKEE